MLLLANPLRSKYRMSQMNPREAVVLQKEVDDQCDKLASTGAGKLC